MAAQDHLGMQFKPIYKTDLPDLPTVHSGPTASQPVSHQEFQAQAARGQARLDSMRARSAPTPGLEGQRWDAMVDHAYTQTREPWGGATYNARTGNAVDFHKPDKLALTVREPHEDPISVSPLANRQQFGEAMDKARAQFGSRLGYAGHHLGVFHDADAGRIDLDPTVVVGDSSRKGRQDKGVQAAREIMQATNARGGAYHFASGDGFWPNHVAD